MRENFFRDRKTIFLLILICLLIPLITPAFSLSQKAKEANSTLNEAKIAIKKMENSNFSTQRVNDLYLGAKQQYKAQLALERAGGEPDYSVVFKKASQISSLKNQSFLLSDKLAALKMRIKESNVNMSKAWKIYHKAVKEFENERYEKSEKLIEKAYSKISELESKAARVAAFYESISETLENFIKKHILEIVSTIVAIIIIVIIFYKRIKIHRLKRQLNYLELRKKVLRDLIAEAQKKYFEKGEMGEETYNIRVKRFGEMIRDVNRQIPVIKEKISKVKKPEEKKEQEEKEKQRREKLKKQAEKREKQRRKEEKRRQKEMEKQRKKEERRKQKERKRKEKEEKKKEKQKEKERKRKEAEKKAKKAKDKDLEQITKDLSKLEKKAEKSENPVRRTIHKLKSWKKRKEMEKKLKEI